MFSFRGYFKLGSTSYTELAKRVFREVVDEDCSEHAAAMAYYFMFALFPFFLFLITLIGYLPIPKLLEYLLDQASTMLPGQVFTLIQDNSTLAFHEQAARAAFARFSACALGLVQCSRIHHGRHEQAVRCQGRASLLEGQAGCRLPGDRAFPVVSACSGSAHVRDKDRRHPRRHHQFRCPVQDRLGPDAGTGDPVAAGTGRGLDLLLHP